MKFIIINTNEVYNTTYGYNPEEFSLEEIIEKELENPNWTINFEGLEQGSVNDLKFNNDKTKCILSYRGDCPDFLKDKTSYTYSEIQDELSKEEWN